MRHTKNPIKPSIFLRKLCLRLILIFIAQTGPVYAAVDASRSETALVPSAHIIEDEQNRFSLDEVLRQKPNTPPAHGLNTASFGFTDTSHWFVSELSNPGQQPLHRLLVFSPTWLDRLDIHLIFPNGQRQHIQGGDTLPFSQRAIDDRKLNYAIELPPGETQLVVHTATSDPYLVDMTLWERSAFFENEAWERVFLGLLYGAMLAMLLYNLALYISIRERVYASYIAYVFFFLIMHANYNGHAYPVLWPDSPVWGNWAHSVFIYLFILSGVAFAINFLDLKLKQPKAYRWALGLALALGASFVLTALGGYKWHVRTSIIWVVFYAPYVLALGVFALRAGNRAARFFLTAAVAGFIGSFVTAITVSGFIPYSFISYHAVDAGMLIDAFLLSIALADRLRIARNETEQVKADLLRTTQAQARQLEQTVELRTAELRQANADKDAFYSVIAHDLKGPIGGLDTLFGELLQSPAELDDETFKQVKLSVNKTRLLLDDLLSWAQSQKGELLFNPEPIDITEILRGVQDLYAAQARNKNITLNFVLDQDYWVCADATMINTVVRNLINNALKFTASGGYVKASVEAVNDTYRVAITDNGIGMTEDTIRTLFRPETKIISTEGTSGEVGTGLGLILCADFVQKNQGEIGAISEQGKGSTIWFSLPAVTKAQGSKTG